MMKKPAKSGKKMDMSMGKGKSMKTEKMSSKAEKMSCKPGEKMSMGKSKKG